MGEHFGEAAGVLDGTGGRQRSVSMQTYIGHCGCRRIQEHAAAVCPILGPSASKVGACLS